MQHYTILQWPNRKADAKPKHLGTFPLRSVDGEPTLLDGLNAVLEMLAEKPRESRWLSVGACYSGEHTLNGWDDSNCIVLEYESSAAAGLCEQLHQLGVYAIQLFGTDGPADKGLRCIVIIPLDGKIASSKDFTRLTSMAIHDLKQVGLTGGQSCTFFFHAPSTFEPADAFDTEELFSIDRLGDDVSTDIKKWG